MDVAKRLIGSLVRKALFALGSVWIAKLIEAGVLTNADIDRMVEVVAAAALLILPALWTDFIKPWIVRMIARQK